MNENELDIPGLVRSADIIVVEADFVSDSILLRSRHSHLHHRLRRHRHPHRRLRRQTLLPTPTKPRRRRGNRRRRRGVRIGAAEPPPGSGGAESDNPGARETGGGGGGGEAEGGHGEASAGGAPRRRRIEGLRDLLGRVSGGGDVSGFPGVSTRVSFLLHSELVEESFHVSTLPDLHFRPTTSLSEINSSLDS